MTSPGHNQNWIYDDVTQIFNMAPKPRHDPGSLFSSLLCLEMTFSHSTLGAASLNDEEAYVSVKQMATGEVCVFSGGKTAENELKRECFNSKIYLTRRRTSEVRKVCFISFIFEKICLKST